MPHIKITSNTPIPREKQAAIKAQLGQDASIIGKTESWLMVELCESVPLFFKGSDAPAAIASVDLYGAAGADKYGKMTAAITKLLSGQLDIPADRIFVKYSEYKHWGWNGSNF